MKILSALESKSEKHSLVLVLLAAFLWSFGGVLIKNNSMDPLSLAGARSFVASITIMLLCPLQISKFKTHIIPAICYAAMVISFVTATKLTSAANAIAIQYTAPVFIGLFCKRKSKESFHFKDWVLTIILLIGVGLFFIDKVPHVQFIGNCVACICAMAFAFFVLTIRNEKVTDPTQCVLLGNIIAFSICSVFIARDLSTVFLFENVVSIILLGIFQLGISYIFYTLAIKYIRAIDSVIATAVELILNPVWVFIIRGELPHIVAFTGWILILFVICGNSFKLFGKSKILKVI
jgi:drug/metabolite transporter (DMT)-like permease